MIITRARRDDVAAIVDLERDGFDEANWSADSWLAEIEGDDRCVLAARDETERVLGVATFQSVADTADLHRVVVGAPYRSRGIGASLLRAGLEWAQAVGAGRVVLEVRTDNTAAISLYEALGFLPIATREDYYGPGLHAVVMSRDLAPLTVIAETGWESNE